MIRGATGPLLSFVALFALPLLGALTLDTNDFAFWALLASISTIALSLDFGGTALLTSRYHFASRIATHIQASLLSVVGALIVGCVGVLAWVVLASTTFAGTTSVAEGILAIAAMSLAAAVRSVLLVIAQSSLLEGWISIRNLAMAGHAFGAVAITSVWLLVAPSYWALPMGWLLSGAILLPCCVIWFSVKARRSPHTIKGTHELNWVRFAMLRTVNTLVASAVLQGDRWIVALVGGPVWLALYEVAWRFAALPRTLVQALAIHVSADVAPMTSEHRDEMTQLVRRSTTIVAAVAVLGSIAVGVAYVAFTNLASQSSNITLFVLMVIAFSAMAVTSPLSIAGTTVGRAAIDLPYAGLALVGMLASATWAILDGNIWIFFVGYFISLLGSVPIFFAYAPRWVRSGLERRKRNPTPAPTELERN